MVLDSPPKVCAVIPYYYGSEYIQEAVNSVNNQTYKNVEVIIVNDSPKDEDFDGVKFEDLTVIEHERNRGMYAARNTGWKQSNAKYVTFLDQDDILYPEKIERQVSKMENNPDIGMCLTNVVDVSGDREIISKRNSKVDFVDFNTKEVIEYFIKIWEQDPLPLTSELVRHECLKEVNGYDESMYGCGDRDLLLKINNEYKIKIINEYLMERRHHNDNASESNIEMIKDRRVLSKRVLEQYPSMNHLCSKREAYLDLMEAKANIDNGEFIKGLSNIPKIFYRHPYFISSQVIQKIFRHS